MAAMAAIYSWISNPNDFSYFDLLVTPMFSIRYQDNWPFVSGEAQNMMVAMVASLDFRSERVKLVFCSTRHPDASYQVSNRLAFRFKRITEKYIFKIAALAAVLYFQSETAFAIFDVQVTLMRPTKIQVN